MARFRDECDRVAMVKLAIVSHPCTPVSDADLEDWLESRVAELREATPGSIVRLSRLAQDLPDSEIGIGWLIDVEVPEESAALTSDGLADVLSDLVTDMRFLGMQPKVLAEDDPPAAPGDTTEPGSDPPAAAGPLLDYPGLA